MSLRAFIQANPYSKSEININQRRNNMNYEAQATNQMAGQSRSTVDCTVAPQSASEAIISRLTAIRSYLAENRSSANHAADKIVGSAPQPPVQTGQIKGERPEPYCFLDSLSQIIGDIEDIMRETQDHLSRLHRSF
jgi:hypothetical protein